MQIDLLDVTENEGMVLDFRFPYGPGEIRFQRRRFSVLDPGEISLTVENIGKKVLSLRGSGQITVGIPCDRCLTETQAVIPFSFERKLDMKLSPEELAAELDEDSYLDGVKLDTDALVLLEILMNWPQKILCEEDCKGLCIRCGKNLNEGLCSCEEPLPDPRMAAIRDLFAEFQ